MEDKELKRELSAEGRAIRVKLGLETRTDIKLSQVEPTAIELEVGRQVFPGATPDEVWLKLAQQKARDALAEKA